jgi:Putative restriction endonuclease
MCGVSEAALIYRWSRDEFVRAWEAGVFDHRVELVEGEVWPVVIGPWHGKTTMRVARALPDAGGEVTSATLPAGDSLPDPDCWVLRAGAEPSESIGARLVAWRPEDVLLVVEVADETVLQDLGVKARLYGRAGYGVYWVVTQDVIYEHTEPTPDGYRVRVEHRRGDRIPVRYAGAELGVDDLLG